MTTEMEKKEIKEGDKGGRDENKSRYIWTVKSDT